MKPSESFEQKSAREMSGAVVVQLMQLLAPLSALENQKRRRSM
jgi:hypothetical protein